MKTLQDAIAAKRLLEKEILTKILTFELDYGVVISYLSLERNDISTQSQRESLPAKVNILVTL